MCPSGAIADDFIEMSASRPDSHIDGWAAEDFVDPALSDYMEYDPWDGPPTDDESGVTIKTPAQLQLPGLDVDADTRQASPEEDMRNELPSSSSPTPSFSKETEATSEVRDVTSVPVQEDLTTQELPTLVVEECDSIEESLEWDYHQLGGAALQELEYSTDSTDWFRWDEPEPLAEPDSNLSEPLYSIDYNLTEVTRKLKSGEFIASIDEVTDVQRDRVIGILESFSVAQLRSWLPWLRGKAWIGESLLLFLDFWDLWHNSPHWWEYSVWDRWVKIWWPYFNQSVLSRDKCYYLIQHRLHYQPKEVIDATWFVDWYDHSLWKHGFADFASFAVFRATLSNEEDWRNFLS